MKSVGIICEYNPFHNGHLYHINKIKELFSDYKIILILDGYFTERGDVSIIDKWEKTNIALNYGVDLVVELPFVFATQSADIFAKASIKLLDELNVDYLVFGSETGNIDVLNNIAKIQLSKQYDKLVKENMNEGNSYPKSVANSIYKLTKTKIDKPNDILGVAYIREIMKLNSSIIPYTIKRTTDYNDTNLYKNITSATSIRNAIKNKTKVKDQVPPLVLPYIKKNNLFIDDYFELLKYKIISDSTRLNIYNTVNEGIENRITKYIINSYSLNELIMKVKTKRYTYNKLNRMMTHILCGFTKDEAKKFNNVEYIRILGFNSEGQKYLKDIKGTTSIPIISKYSDISNEILSIEFRSACIYASILNKDEKELLLKKEITSKPIII